MKSAQVLIVSCCGLIAALVLWALLRAAQTGKISSRGWTFDVGENAGWFLIVVICDVIILAGSVWIALQTLGIVEGAPAWLSAGR